MNYPFGAAICASILFSGPAFCEQPKFGEITCAKIDSIDVDRRLPQKLAVILQKEITERGGPIVNLDGANLVISDCGTFAAILVVPGGSDASNKVRYGSVITVIFAKSQWTQNWIEGSYFVSVY